MSNLALIYDRQFQDHLNPESHPESPSRLAALERALYRHELIHQLDQLSTRPATEDELASVHDPRYIEELAKTSAAATAKNELIRPNLDTDTWVSPQSYRTAKLAAGAGLVALDAVMKDGYTSSFVAVRPPGHHALADRSYGYCLFNNVAVAARYAQQKLGLSRVLIIDWDVHHGNGTQDLFYDDASVCFISLHQFPLWPPETGWYTEDGKGAGRGYNMNVPLPAGTGDTGYLKVWESLVEPQALEYQPQLIIISAGYDAHQFDPLGQQQVTTRGYRQLSQRLASLSQQVKAPLVCFLEGGYNTQTTAESAVTTMSVLNSSDQDSTSSAEPTSNRSQTLVDQRIEDISRHFSHYWPSLRRRLYSVARA